MIGVVYLYDNAHYQYRQGFVSDEFWASTHASLRNFMKNPVVNDMIMGRLDTGMRPEFREVVLSVGKELESTRDD